MKKKFSRLVWFSITVAVGVCSSAEWSALKAETAPSSYTAYTGTDARPMPPAPVLGPANSVVTDPTFGSKILRVTDSNTKSGQSFISVDSGFSRAWNADSTAIKLSGPRGDGYWLEFDPAAFKVGDGSSRPVPHPVPFGTKWEWSVADPDVLYFLKGNQIAAYNKATGATTNLGGPSTGENLAYMAVVVGRDNWVCAAAGAGIQNTWTKLFCLSPASPGTSKFVDVYNKTVNGVRQADPNWPTSASGQVIGIHDISGGTGDSWLEVTFHQQSWGGNGGAIFNLSTDTWSLITKADIYWGGHVSMGNGRYANASGSKDGRDSRGWLLRNPDNAMNSGEYTFVYQPSPGGNGWCDADHGSWLNSVNNPGAPILISRYGGGSCYQYAWTGEIDAAAVDGSNTVWRFAHNHNANFSCYFGQAFAQISNDGKWALFSSYWDGALGADTSFGCSTRIDTFIVDLMSPKFSSSTDPVPPSPTTPDSSAPSGGAAAPTAAAGASSRIEQNGAGISYSLSWYPVSNSAFSGGAALETMQAGARATFQFEGTGVSWIGYKDQYSGIANVYVDGALKAAIDTYTSGQQIQATNYSISGLVSGTHTIVIEATGNRNGASSGSWIWVDAFDVIASSPSTPVVDQTPSLTSLSFEFKPSAGMSAATVRGSAALKGGYVQIQAASGSQLESGFALYDLRMNGVLVSEAAVQAMPAALGGRTYAEANRSVRTGLAVANPNDQDATISFYFTNQSGADQNRGSIVIPAHAQIALFLDEAPFNIGSFTGSFTFSANVPVAALALRVSLNERSELLMTTLPVTPLAALSGASVAIPQFADGGGWSTSVLLVNPTDSTLKGTVEFISAGTSSAGGTAQSITVNGQAGQSFPYAIAPRSSVVLETANASAVVQSGWIQVTPESGSGAPASIAIFRLSRSGVLVSETGVSGEPASSLNLYVETSAGPNGLAEVNAGLALANASSVPASVTFSLSTLEGAPTGLSSTIVVPAKGRLASFLTQLPGLEQLPSSFKGILTIRSTVPLSAIGLRGHINERGEFLMTTLPVVNNDAPESNPQLIIPHFVDGGGFTTQFVVFSNAGAGSSGAMMFLDQNGQPLGLKF